MKALPAFLASTLAALSLLGCGRNANPALDVPVTYSITSAVLGASSAPTPNHTVLSLENASSSSVDIALSLSGDPAFALVPSLSCGGTTPSLLPGTTCIAVVAFNPTTAGSFNASLTLASVNGGAAFNRTVPLTASAVSLAPGQSLVQGTQNPQVALYSWFPTAAGDVSVRFTSAAGDTHVTGTVPATGNAPVTLYVAGLLQNTAYSLQAQLTPASGAQASDVSHSFTTAAWVQPTPQVAAATTAGQTPAPGIELVNTTDLAPVDTFPLFAVDLSGRLLWAYHMQDTDAGTTIVQSPRQLANGDFLLLQGPASQAALTPEAWSVNDLREIDYAGNIVRHLTVAQLNSALAQAGFTNLNLQTLHHDIEILPNGHLLVFGNIFETVSGLTGYPAPVNVLGDVLIDLDPNWNPVWVWNAFNNLNPNYHPAASAFPDWTHCNKIQYEPDDGNLILSCRHLSWLIKINYLNGSGNGNVLWRIGNQGDFTLSNGTAPLDWQYAQHYFDIIGSASAGTFLATMIDNGDYRFNNAGEQVCQGTLGSGSDCYTTEPVYQINESARTVNVLWRHVLPAANFSFFGGQAGQLANGDLEFTLSSQPDSTSTITEYVEDSDQTQVWQLTLSHLESYRGGRLAGLYPGVTW